MMPDLVNFKIIVLGSQGKPIVIQEWANPR